MQDCREWTVNQLPVWALALELDTPDLQIAIPDIADGNRTLGGAAGLNATEARGAGDSQFARRRIPG